MFIVAYAFLYALALIQLGAYVDMLPAKMATHFAAGGAPNGYMRKESFILFYLSFMFFMPGITFAISLLIEKLPGMINLPNKDYWMRPARRQAAIASLVAGFRFLGLMVGLLLIAVDQLVINANMVSPPHLDEHGIWMFLAVFVFALVGFFGWLTVRYRLPSKE